jgi:AraC-like DNA-binding protein
VSAKSHHTQGVRTERAASHDEWAHVASQHFVPLEPAPLRHRRDKFLAEIKTAPCGSLHISSLQASQAHVQRGARQIRESRGDLILAGFQLTGTAVVRQADRTAVIKAGEFTFFDTARPYEIEARQEFSQVVISFPRDRFSPQVPAFERLTAVTLDASRSSNSLLLRMVDQMAMSRPKGSVLELEAIAAALESLAVATLRALVADGVEISRGQQTRAQIVHYVLHNLRDPFLNVDRVAADLHLSESTVYRAFKDFDVSLPGFIWQKRLEGIRVDFKSPGMDSRRLGEVASEWGYSDYSLFCRKFKAATGLSPRDYVKAFHADRLPEDGSAQLQVP